MVETRAESSSPPKVDRYSGEFCVGGRNRELSTGLQRACRSRQMQATRWRPGLRLQGRSSKALGSHWVRSRLPQLSWCLPAGPKQAR